MKKWKLIKQSKLVMIKSKVLSMMFNELKSMGSSWENLTIQLVLKGFVRFRKRSPR